VDQHAIGIEQQGVEASDELFQGDGLHNRIKRQCLN
jgi:hypothetical protein